MLRAIADDIQYNIDLTNIGSAPLTGMGLTMGHAIAFALASTGICLSSIPLLVNVLGRRGALAMVCVYLVIPFLLGIVINAVPVFATLGPAPF